MQASDWSGGRRRGKEGVNTQLVTSLYAGVLIPENRGSRKGNLCGETSFLPLLNISVQPIYHVEVWVYGYVIPKEVEADVNFG